METKVCRRCNIKKDVSKFEVNRRQCKSCRYEQIKRYRENKPVKERLKLKEHNKEYQKEYRKNNKERLLLEKKKYYEKNKERFKEHNKEYQKEYRKNNKEKILERQKKYYEKNKEWILKRISKKYYEDNKEKILERQKKLKGPRVCKKCNSEKDITEFPKQKRTCKLCIIEYNRKWRKENWEWVKERDSKYKKEYYEDNKEKIFKRNREYYRKRIKTDVLFKLSSNIRTSIRSSIIKGGYSKKSRTFEILGCSYEELKEQIESQFEDWMNWDNYGLYNGEEKYGWDLDHIVPVSSAECEEDIYKLNHYSNIQPLCSYVNRCVKRDIIDWKS